jgi:hypothetical protein
MGLCPKPQDFRGMDKGSRHAGRHDAEEHKVIEARTLRTFMRMQGKRGSKHRMNFVAGAALRS